MNGGYCMIDATGVNAAAESAATVTGLYVKVFRCMALNKPVIFKNILSGDNGLYTPLPGACLLGENSITVDCGVVKFTISSVDSIEIVTE